MADPSPPTTAATDTPLKTYTYYHAGPLFTLGDLTTNIALSSLISTLSFPSPSNPSPTPRPHFTPILPQDLEPRTLTPHSIRDSDIRALLSCDLALFIYDGAELDAGTVVEYMVAKMADIPSVILRTDFRGGGDQGGDDKGEGGGGGEADKWNLMSSFWPRTRGVRVDSMAGYKANLSAAAAEGGGPTTGTGTGTEAGAGRNRRAAEGLLRETAETVVRAMEEVVALPPRLPRELRGQVYEWLALMPGFKEGGDGENVQWARGIMEGKVAKGLL